MHSLSYLTFLLPIASLVLGGPLASDHTTPRSLQRYPYTRRDLPAYTVQKELGPLLSNGSRIFGPENSGWDNATERWNIYTRGDVKIVVLPGKESDVPAIVKYCNDNCIEFMAYGRGHGVTTTVHSFKGLQINLELLNNITPARDGASALIQGGLANIQIQESLWEQGYVTTTGTTGCVGAMGAALGGGHGIYEGQYGLVSDNLIHLNLVLADSSTIGVNATSYPDLWWAMRGAGHNFGIVTSAIVKIYPRKIDTWHYHNYWWTGDKLEAVLEAINSLHVSDNGTTPPLMGFEAGQYAMNHSISETEAVLYWSFAYAGPAEDGEKLLAPFRAIEFVDETSGDTSWPNLSNSLAAAGEAAACGPQRFAGTTTMTGPHNITAQRQILDLFNRKAAEYPALAATSQIYNEGYANKATQEIPSDSSAYPLRDKSHLIFFVSVLDEQSTYKDIAEEWQKETWDIWQQGQGPESQPVTYANYVFNHPWETQQSIYGYEPWRLERLKELKQKYDRYNRFRFFVPIVK